MLPFILIPVMVVLGLGYWRFVVSQPSQSASKQVNVSKLPVEVPKTLPKTNLEGRVQSLEDTIAKIGVQASPTPASGAPTYSSSSIESRLSVAEAAITDLKARVSVLEKATPAPASTVNKYPLYIPLGSGGGPWQDQTWTTLNEYQVSINPDNYPGYSSMQLEVNFRLSEAAGTGSVRLYNVTDGSSVVSQLDTTSNTFATQTSGTFKLPGGQKTYTIQVQNTQGKQLFVQSARIKVNF